MIKPINDGSGWGIHQDSTWFHLIQEVLKVFEQPPEGKTDRKKAVLCVFEALCSSDKDIEIWHEVKVKILVVSPYMCKFKNLQWAYPPNSHFAT